MPGLRYVLVEEKLTIRVEALLMDTTAWASLCTGGSEPDWNCSKGTDGYYFVCSGFIMYLSKRTHYKTGSVIDVYYCVLLCMHVLHFALV